MKNLFIAYIKSRPKSSKSSKHYVSGINAISKRFLDYDLFTITSEAEIKNIIANLEKNVEFVEANKNGDRMYLVAIKHYAEFLSEYNKQQSEEIQNTVNIDEDLVFPDEIDNKLYPEGGAKTVLVNKYERNPKAKKECIKYYGTQCRVCGFKFSDKYGKEFEGKIHVHHVKPIAELGKEYQIDPIRDLIPVCPNCHLILHSKGKNQVYTIDEVKQFIRKNL